MTDTSTITKILELREQKLNYSQIAKELGITKDTARYHCQQHGLGEIDANIPCPTYTKKQGEQIKDMYLNKGMTPSEIAVALKRSPNGIRKYLLRHGIKKARNYTSHKDNIDKVKLPPPIADPIYYPDRKITAKSVVIKGRKYSDISEVYGL